MGFFKRFQKPKANVSLSVPQNTVELGAHLDVTATVSSQEEFDATEVRAELRCVERKKRERLEYNERLRRKVRRVYWDQATLHSADSKGAGKLHLVPGFQKAFPIHVDIPAGGRESFDGIDANVTWFIKGVLAIDGRPDVTGKVVELQIVKPSVSSAVPEKEIPRIPCMYCETLMPTTVTSCPTCGAPRRT